VDEKGQTLAPAASLPQRPDPVAPQAQLSGDDPLAHLTPGERFTRAIQRRDALVRDRQKNPVDDETP
jgi:hypothetical protein